MGFLVKCGELRKQTQAAFASVGSKPVAIHTDISRIGVPEGATSKDAMKTIYGEIFDAIASERTVLIPAFNYDFCKTGVYSVEDDPSQLGQFTEYMRRRTDIRTQTPVFNFTVMNYSGCPLEPSDNPFGATSTFQWLMDNDGWVAFFGAKFMYNTFVHFIEESIPVTYRYHKLFPGVVTAGKVSQKIELIYRVKPMIPGAVDYDWTRHQKETVDAGIVESHCVGHGEVLVFRCRSLYDFWRDKMLQDDRYLLTAESRKMTDELYAKYGCPLTVIAVEGIGASS